MKSLTRLIASAFFLGTYLAIAGCNSFQQEQTANPITETQSRLRISRLEEDIKKQKSDYDSLEIKYIDLERQTKRFRIENSSLKGEIENLPKTKQEYRQRIADLELKIAKTNLEKTILEKSKIEAQNKAACLEVQVIENYAPEDYAEMQRRIVLLNQDYTNLQEENMSLRNQLLEVRGKLRDLQLR